MVANRVLITTSGMGSRLGNLTNGTNKCLVRVADKPSISHIIESYSADTEFVISLGHHGDYVKQYLNLAYPDHTLIYVYIDNYDGPGSSLAYSIFQCKNELQCPFIFHASDTIVTTRIPDLENNWMASSYRVDASHYRTLLVENQKIKKVNKRHEINYDTVYVGLCGIKDYELFFDYLEEILKTKKGDLSDAHVIDRMLEDVDFDQIEIPSENWFDVGNVDELNRTRKFFANQIEVLAKEYESIYFFDEFIIKFFADPTTNKNRVARGHLLGKVTPPILDYSNNFFKYKKVDGEVFSKSVTGPKFLRLLDWAISNLWISKEDLSIRERCYDFYINKTKSRVDQYLKNRKDQAEYINGTKIPTVDELLGKIDIDWLCDGIPSVFHGDFILDNIIETSDGFSLIDWRQDFGGDLETGDLYYDLAKLNHNLTVNHNIVKRELYGHKSDGCFILTSSILNECKELLHKFVIDNGYDLRKIELLTAIIWINMAPLHAYPFGTFLYTFGKYNLYQALERL